MSLLQVIDRVKQFEFKVDSRLVQSIIQNKLDYIFNDPVCEKCKTSLRYKYTKEVKTNTTIGQLNFQFPYFYCPKCKSYHSPHQEVLNIRPGKYQYDVQKIAARMSTDGTFEETSELLKDIYGFDISPDTVHRLTNDLAAEVQLAEITPTPEEVRQIVAKISEGKHRRPVFVFATDGAMVPVRTAPKNTPNCQWPSILTHIRPTILTHFEAETAAVWLYPLSFSQPYKPGGGGNLEGVEHDTQNQSVT